MSFSTFTLDNPGSVPTSFKSDRFKGEEGKEYRVSFLWWGGIEEGAPVMEKSPQFASCHRMYVQGAGYVLDKGPEFLRLAQQVDPKVKKARLAIGTVVVSWPLKDGRPDKTALANGEYKVMPWVFSEDKVKSILRKHQEWPLSEHDLTIACTDTQFQKMDFSITRDNLFATLLSNESKIAKDVISKAQVVVENMNNTLANDYTLDQFKEKLGLEVANPTGSVGASSGEIDDMLGDILDDD